jgi:hypothetical protein
VRQNAGSILVLYEFKRVIIVIKYKEFMAPLTWAAGRFRHRRLFLLGASLFPARVPTNYRGAPHFLSGKPSIEGGARRFFLGAPPSGFRSQASDRGAPHRRGD